MRLRPARSSDLLRPHWALRLYPQAAEAGGCLRVPEPRGSSSWGSDPERAALEAVRRARAKIRRYAVANRLNRFGTLTYAGEGCRDPEQLREDVPTFFRELRPALGGKRLPYVWVPEWHPGGHGLHVHFAVGRYVPQPLIRDVWERGHVFIKLLSDLPVGSGAVEEARVAARYLSKYVGKGFGDERRRAGLHRYEVAQGFQPEKLVLTGRSDEDVLAQASDEMGAAPEKVWRSSTVEGWHGPPAVWAAWPE